MILFSKGEGLIKATGIRKLDGTRDANYKLPHIAVGVFSEYLLEDIVEKFECVKVGFISGANCSRPVYIMKYDDIKITLFMAGVSGPWISADIVWFNKRSIYNGINWIYKWRHLERLEKVKEENMLHKMKLQEDPFERIKNGTKTVEFRLYDEKRQTIQIGDEIEFSKLPELQEKLLVKVIDLYKEESFEKLFKKVFVGEDKEKIIEKAKSMNRFYTPEQEKEYGVVGIKIEIIK